MEFKLWDTVNKQLVTASDKTYQVTIALSGAIDVCQNKDIGLGVIRGCCRDSEDFLVLHSTGLASKESQQIFPGDILQKEGEKDSVTVFYGEYESSPDSWGVKAVHFGPYIKFHDGGVYAITQSGSGYSVAASDYTIIGFQVPAQPEVRILYHTKTETDGRTS